MSLVLLGLHKARMQGEKKDHVKKMNNYRNIFLVPLYVESSGRLVCQMGNIDRYGIFLFLRFDEIPLDLGTCSVKCTYSPPCPT